MINGNLCKNFVHLQNRISTSSFESFEPGKASDSSFENSKSSFESTPNFARARVELDNRRRRVAFVPLGKTTIKLGYATSTRDTHTRRLLLRKDCPHARAVRRVAIASVAQAWLDNKAYQIWARTSNIRFTRPGRIPMANAHDRLF